MPHNYKNSYKVMEKELVSLSVYNVGFQKCTPGYRWGPGIRDHYLIHYVISGQGSYMVNEKSYDLNPGDSFLVYPNTEVSYTADLKNPWEYAWVGFTGSDAPMILNATDFSQDSPVISGNIPGESIHRQILHIYDARGNGLEHAVEMTGRLYTMLSLFMQNSSHKKTADTASSYVQKGIEFISANYSYNITVEDIADYVGLSRSHLFRSFQNVLHVSPKEYLTAFRMKQACYLLEHSRLSVTAIANSIGFDNSLYFSKVFRQEKQMSPREYRKNLKGTT
ncbi:MAG: AraC family transcriptional regulator [Roseburia sp.]|nr:AraC family transcriptional regulator [Roseburia sp.]